ncbi:MAG: VRR-NUC domain-containing protein [Pseudomonadales bacterium]
MTFIERHLEEGAPYYVRNFLGLIGSVFDRYNDLLSGDERALIRGLCELDANGRRLYVRLVCRKGPVLRCARLDYPEIDVPRALDELAGHALLERRPARPVEELLRLLTAPELRAVLADLGACRAGRKLELVERLMEYADELCLESYLDWCVPLRRSEMELFRLLFFGNGEQGLTDFVLEELGIVRYESYPIDAVHRLFDDRATVEELGALYQISEASKAYIEQCEDEALATVRDALWHPHAHPELERKRSRTLNRIGHYFERRKAFDEALSAYARSKLPPARERQARIFAKLDDANAALALCEQILKRPHDEFEGRFAMQFGARIRGEKRARPCAVPMRRLWLAQAPLWPVEHVAAWQLENEGWTAHYVQNHLANALFGLAFWDVIFHPLKGVFHHPFQFGPTDLLRPQFRSARASLIADRLKEIEGGAVDRILRTFDAKHGLANALVNWRHLERSLIEQALQCIPGRHLAAIFDRMSRDLARYRTGFPDLLLLDPVNRRYEFVEVKGMGDRLQIHQRRWIDHFVEHGVPVELMRVVWPG